ncbi:MAG: autotransporter outer membrane beta-barrel domain-containing protein, partial [Alphaproteobacteria bacterium]|nr:autotransporter outer membrane beta-barrel domain-containing protein [Alphaproteobacteria bacterium]
MTKNYILNALVAVSLSTPAFAGYEIETVPSDFKFVSEGQLASVALLNQGADLISTTGIKNAINAVNVNDGTGAFGAASVGYSKYNTGSHINLMGTSVMAGVATKLNADTVIAGFAEGGYGHAHTTNSISNPMWFGIDDSEIKGANNTEYYGGGVMIRYNDSCINCLYAEASGRAGYVHNEWDGDHMGYGANYTTGAMYAGAHLTLGYESDIAGVVGYDIYGKYAYTHQNGDKIVDNAMDLKNINSHKSVFGGRFSLNTVKRFTPFIGMAWEHEYGSFANADVNMDGDAFGVPAPGMRGNTGIFEAGVTNAKATRSNWNFDGEIQGYTGVRQGFGGTFH